MQIGVAAQDVKHAGLLVQEFARIFKAKRVSLTGEGNVEVEVDAGNGWAP